MLALTDMQRQLAFSETEYDRRLAAVRARLIEHELDGLVTRSLPAICYLTGYETIASLGFALAIVPLEGELLLVSDEFERYNADAFARVDRVEGVSRVDGRHPALVVDRVMRSIGAARPAARWGWDRGLWDLGHRLFESLGSAGPRWSEVSGIVEAAMARKSAEEVEALRAAGVATSAAMRAAIEAVADGCLDTDVAAAAYAAAHRAGSERMAIQPIITSGQASGIPHSTFRGRTIIAGDPVVMEFGACVRRYSAPMFRTPVVGRKPDDAWGRMHDACLEAVALTIEGLRPGVSGRELAESASTPLRRLPDGVFHDGQRGYSVGIGFEPLWIDCPSVEIVTDEWATDADANAGFVVEEGHVYHVRGATRVFGRYGAAVSETVLVTADGAEVLTSVPRDLIVV